MTRQDERGSAAIEAAIGVPAFALFVGLIIFGGRTANAHEALQSAAADAARSASIARDAQTATTDARAAATASVTNQHIRCTQVDVTVDTSDFNKAPGVPGSVAADLAGGGAPASAGAGVLLVTTSGAEPEGSGATDASTFGAGGAPLQDAQRSTATNEAKRFMVDASTLLSHHTVSCDRLR